MPSVLRDLAWIREKTAARWDKLLRAGQLAEQDVARLRAHAGGASDKEGIQKALQSFVSPLSAEQLARHETYQKKVFPHVEKFHGFESLPFERALQMPGPQYDPASGKLYSDPTTMSRIIRHLGFNEAPSMQRQALLHELQEKRMADPKYRATARTLGSGHLGPGALMAERLGAVNPATHALYSHIRDHDRAGAWEREASKKLKQFGAVGSYTPPLGGRTHRSLDIALHPTSLADYEDTLARHAATAAEEMTPRHRKFLARPASWFGVDINKRYREQARTEIENFLTENGVKPLKPMMNLGGPSRFAEDRVRNFIATQSGG